MQQVRLPSTNWLILHDCEGVVYGNVVHYLRDLRLEQPNECAISRAVGTAIDEEDTSVSVIS